MPVFINEVVIRANVDRPAASGQDAAAGAEPLNRDALVAEVMQVVVEYLERELDRIGER